MRFQYLHGDLHLKVIFNFLGNPNRQTFAILEEITEYALRTLSCRSYAMDEEEIGSRVKASKRYTDFLAMAQRVLAGGSVLLLMDLLMEVFSIESLKVHVAELNDETMESFRKELGNLSLKDGGNVCKISLYSVFFSDLMGDKADGFMNGGSGFLFENRSYFGNTFCIAQTIMLYGDITDEQKYLLHKMAVEYLSGINDINKRVEALVLVGKAVGFSDSELESFVGGMRFCEVREIPFIHDMALRVSPSYREANERGFFARLVSSNNGVFLANEARVG